MSTSNERSYHHGELRGALVASAVALLGEEGIDNLSLRAVARRAGVSAMAPYRHYPDKESLLAAVAAQGFEGLRDVLCAADAEAEPLLSQAVAYVRYARDNPALFRLMFGPKRGAHPAMAAAGESAYAVLAARVAAETPEADRSARTLGCWSLVHGLAVLFLDGRLGVATDAPVDALARDVARVMLGTPG